MIAAAIALAASALAQAPARDTPVPAGSATVRGRVLADGATPRPLSRVEVHAICAPLKVDKGVLTDANGRYEIGELPAGAYTVTFARSNYLKVNYGQRRPLGLGAPIEIANGQTVKLNDMVLQRSAVITGRIVDEFGDAATGAVVMAMRWTFANGQRRLQSTGNSAGVVNDLGEYRLFGLQPGQYFVSVSRNNGTGGSDTADRSSYAATYYPGTGNVAEAQRLTIAAGQTISGINITVQPVAASRISGVALDSRGRPLAGMVFLSQPFVSTFSAYATLRPDGTFTFGAVPPGDYTLNGGAGPHEITSMDLSVTGGDISEVQLVGVVPTPIRGRIVFEPGDVKPPAPSAVTVNVSSGARGRSETARPDGTFEVKTRTGHSIVRTSVSGAGAAAWALKRVIAPDGTDITDSGLDVPASGAVEGVVVELTSRQAEVSGTVVDDAGARVRDCVVVIFAQDAARWQPPSRFIASSRPDQEDTFRVRVPPGDYLAAAFDAADASTPVSDPEILQQLREHALKFSIADGEKQTLKVQLGPPPIY